MLDMGFSDAIAAIVERLPSQRQTLLFSATYPESIETLSATLQREPVAVDVEPAHDERQIRQLFFEVTGERPAALIALLEHYRPASCVVFCNTKVQCGEVATALRERGLAALALHGDLEQRERDEVLVRFANGSVPILIATDVAARGLDIKDLAAVINYELTRDPEVHVHRIGRTGRAGGEGLALSLFAPAEARRVSAIETYQKRPVVFGELPQPRAVAASAPAPAMATICIDAGRKDKIRPGDILGALTAAGGIAGSAVGKIDLADHQAYVAIARDQVDHALRCLAGGRIKGRSVRARRVD